MDDWDNFYMLTGGTGGTLIGLIFVVITLGIDHAKKGDELRASPLRHAHPRLFHQPACHCDGDGAAHARHGARPLAGGDWLRWPRLCDKSDIAVAGQRHSRGEGLTEGLRLLFYVLLPLTAYALFCHVGRGLGARSAVRQRHHRLRRGDPAADRIAQQLDDHAGNRPARITARLKKRRGDPIGLPRLLSLLSREARPPRDQRSMPPAA